MTEFAESLIDRMIGRVKAARLAVDRQANATGPGVKRQQRAHPASPHAPSLGEIRESQSLRRVFRDLRVLYRRYRSQTGGQVAPGLRDAAYHFRAKPTLAALVAVAAFLDERDLLG